MAAYSFTPQGQQEILLRDPLTFGFSVPASAKEYKPIYSQQSDQSDKLHPFEQEALISGGVPKKITFYSRNKPHPGRIHHIKDLVDNPICSIEDNTERRNIFSPPSGQDNHGGRYQPPGNTRFSARGKLLPAIGVVPVTFAWRDELEKKANNAINRVLSKPPPSRGGVTKKDRARSVNQFDFMDDDMLLDLLCRILQTESIPACQTWLKAAAESEKTIVLNMIKIAATGESPSKHPKASRDNDIRYVWAPETSQAQPKAKYSLGHDLNPDDEEFRFSFQNEMENDNVRELGLYDTEDVAWFKYPENDKAIQTSRQATSRQGSHMHVSRAASLQFANLPSHSKGQRPPSSAARLALAQNLSKDTSEHLQSYLRDQSHTGRRSRSASLSGPMATTNVTVMSKRPRSRSATIGNTAAHSSLPPIAGSTMVSVTRERVGEGDMERGSRRLSQKQGRNKLQYTSHWKS